MKYLEEGRGCQFVYFKKLLAPFERAYRRVGSLVVKGGFD